MPASRPLRTTNARRVSRSLLVKHGCALTNIITKGKPVSHQFAKELLAGFAGAEVDKFAETKGMDEVDKERAKHQAKQNAMNM